MNPNYTIYKEIRWIKEFKMTIFLAIFVVEFIWALKVGFNSGRIAAMVLCLIVAVLAYFNIGKRK